MPDTFPGIIADTLHTEPAPTERTDGPAASAYDMAPPAKVINNLQILRFVAAAMVLVDHLQYEITSRPFFDSAHFHPTRLLFWAGGVDIFFVISGFIMFTIGKDGFGTSGASWHFISRRVIRVVPVYWLFTCLMLLSIFLVRDRVNHSDISLSDVVASFLFIPHLNAYGAYYPIMNLGWTLNFEMMFYGLFAIALICNQKIGLIFMGIILAVLALIGMFAIKVPAPFDFWCNSIVLEFGFGIALAWAYQKGMRLSLLAGLSVALLGFVLVAVSSAFLMDVNYLNIRALWMGIPALLICAGLVLSERNTHNNALIQTLVFGGTISFAIYLSHPFSMNATAVLFDRLGLRNPYLYLAVSVPAILAVAALFYLFIERPLTKYLNVQLTNLAR